MFVGARRISDSAIGKIFSGTLAAFACQRRLSSQYHFRSAESDQWRCLDSGNRGAILYAGAIYRDPLRGPKQILAPCPLDFDRVWGDRAAMVVGTCAGI